MIGLNEIEAVSQSLLMTESVDPNRPGANEALTRDQLESLFVLGYSLIQHCQTERAICLFEALYQLYPQNVHIARSLAYVALCAGRFDQAWELLEKIRLCADPGSVKEPGMLLLESRALWGLGRIEPARLALQHFLQASESRETGAV